MSGDDLARRILQLTPPPPEHADAEALLEAISTILAGRAELLARVDVSGRASVALSAEVAARDAAWRASLHTAREQLACRRQNAGKLSAYTGQL